MAGAPQYLGGVTFPAAEEVARGDALTIKTYYPQREVAPIVFNAKTDLGQVIGVAMNDAAPGEDVSVLIGVDPLFNSMKNYQDPFGDASNSSDASSASSTDDLYDNQESWITSSLKKSPQNIIKLKPTAKATRKAIREK